MTAPDWRAERDPRIKTLWHVYHYKIGKAEYKTPVVRGVDERTAKHIAASWRMRETLEKASDYLDLAADVVEMLGNSGTAKEIRNDVKPFRALLASLEETE